MNGRTALAALAIAFLGCAHAKTTDAERSSEEMQEENKREEGAGGEKARPGRAEGQPTERRDDRSAERAGSGADRQRPGDAKPSGERIPISTDASGLLAPGADEKIREKLSEGGFTDGRGKEKVSTEEALRRFQREKELPATGMPDNATVRALGLEPGEVFRSASPEGQQRAGEGVKN